MQLSGHRRGGQIAAKRKNKQQGDEGWDSEIDCDLLAKQTRNAERVRPASHPSVEAPQLWTCLLFFSRGPATVRSFVTLNIPGTELARMPATSLSV